MPAPPSRPQRRRRRIVESDDESEEEVTYEVAPSVAPPQKKSRPPKQRPPQRPAKRPCAPPSQGGRAPVLRENARPAPTRPAAKPRRRGAAPTPRGPPPPTPPEWDVESEDEDDLRAEREAREAESFEASQAQAPTTKSGSVGGAARVEEKTSTCFKCGGVGHWARDCPKKTDGARPSGGAGAPPAPPATPKLTADQRAVAAWRPPAWAADRRGKLVRVVAHAGTGKTTTLTALAANLAVSAAGLGRGPARQAGQGGGPRRHGQDDDADGARGEPGRVGRAEGGRAALAQAELLDFQPVGRPGRRGAVWRADHKTWGRRAEHQLGVTGLRAEGRARRGARAIGVPDAPAPDV